MVASPEAREPFETNSSVGESSSAWSRRLALGGWSLTEGLAPRDEHSLPPRWQVPPKESRHFRLFSLNVAHGRRTKANQPFLRRETAKRNLEAIADTVRDLGPDVVALQEADGPSSWSGNFDHVATIARQANLADHVRGDHPADRRQQRESLVGQ